MRTGIAQLKPEKPADKKLERIRTERDEWEDTASRLKAERICLERTISELKKALADKIAKIDALTENFDESAITDTLKDDGQADCFAPLRSGISPHRSSPICRYHKTFCEMRPPMDCLSP